MADEPIRITKRMDICWSDLVRPVDFGHKFTLRDLLRASVSSGSIPPKLMGAILRCPYVSELWDECKSKPFSRGGDEHIDYLEIYWIGDRHEWSGKVSMSNMWGFHGVGKKGVIPDDLKENKIRVKDPKNHRQAYAVEFTPVYQLSGLPVRICGTMYFVDYKDLDSDRNVEFTPSISLLELMYWVLWELSFCGGTKDRDRKLGEIKKSYDESKKAIASGDWKKFKRFNSKTRKFEDIKDRKKGRQ